MTGFPRRLLIEGEELVLSLHPHAIVLVPPGLVGVLVLVGWALLLPNLPDGGAGSALMWVLLGGGVLLLIWFPVRAYLTWVNSYFVVTSDRVIHRQGIIGKYSMEIPLEAVNDVRFNQTVFERLIGGGDLIIESAGEAGRQAFSDIPPPGEGATHDLRARRAEPAADEPGCGRRGPRRLFGGRPGAAGGSARPRGADGRGVRGGEAPPSRVARAHASVDPSEERRWRTAALRGVRGASYTGRRALVAQWIEHRPPEPVAQVRVLPRVPLHVVRSRRGRCCVARGLGAGDPLHSGVPRKGRG